MIQLIAQVFTIGLAAVVGFGIGWLYRNETMGNGGVVGGEMVRYDRYYETWDDFQDRKRTEKVDLLTVLDWEEEIKENHIN